MKRRHTMPFGAELRQDGATRFRLWAPGAKRVELVLGSGDGSQDAGAGLAMPAQPGGWYEAVVPETPAGARYAYRIDGCGQLRG